ncbi:MAG: hypothetical protein KDC00_01970 [Flavobacteriales bacterium]|nr:hypothetical protein [Flavobacteriales bacterium]
MQQMIGEIGGSSSRWAWLREDGSVVTWPAKGDRFPGYNPVSGDGADFSSELLALFDDRDSEVLRVPMVRVYAAGCGAKQRQERMQLAIANVWPHAKVQVESDLTAAALGLCNEEGGLVLILGTGMSAGHFDGSHLNCPMPSLGYLLGDEGSGADIGRTLLQDAFYERMPSADKDLIFGSAVPVLTDVLDRVHRASHPARELAAYAALLAPHMDRPYVRELITGRFHALTEVIRHFFPLEQRRRVFATGSVAYGFRDLLADCLLDAGMTLTVVEADPLSGLVRYHQRQGS